MKFAFIAKHRLIWPRCRYWGMAVRSGSSVSCSGFHAWLNRSPSQHARYDEVLFVKIKDSFKSSDRTYGARRVWHDLLAEGFSCGLHRGERPWQGHPVLPGTMQPLEKKRGHHLWASGRQ